MPSPNRAAGASARNSAGNLDRPDRQRWERGGDTEISERVERVRERISAAAARGNRDPGDVTVVAAAKFQPVSAILAAARAGLHDVGENYPQELDGKAPSIPGVRWHLIGRLQRNKVKIAVSRGALLHSLDGLALARALGRRASQAGTTAEALIQVEVTDRSAAHGVPAGDLPGFHAACQEIEGLRIRGLMVMPALGGRPEESRAAFARTAELARVLGPGSRELSMGMSDDFEVAVEEGATLVRVGTAIFGPRPHRSEGSHRSGR
ncbi:YggS family pyridoxal phosphate-dependent enzyme [Actinomadura rubrisoli]|nr:YggS family pyridoxal phosphate-dependent enzyme [Actinomadura rubrisoli]